MTKDVWRNDIERDAWVESNCDRCYEPNQAMLRLTGDGPGCPHLARSLQNKLPTPWARRRNAVMGETYRCAAFTPRPPVNRRGTSTEETPPMFDDVEPDEYRLVPIETWPDYRAEARKQKEGDHQ